MEVDCENCAGCCIDWRPLSPHDEHERGGARDPLDDTYNLVPLTREDVRGFVDAGLADALRPRLWQDDSGVEVDGYTLAAIDGRPVFFVGLRKPEKPVAPFGADPTWLPSCIFLDPDTLQCRIHDADLYPEECAEYPGHNLALDSETECERVEDAFGGDRLLDDTTPEGLSGLLLGPQALGSKVFCYPDPDDLDGVVERVVSDDLTAEDRARFVAAAAAGSPGTVAINENAFADYRDRALDADSWVSAAIEDWDSHREDSPNPGLAEQVEEDRGAPTTPGWNA